MTHRVTTVGELLEILEQLEEDTPIRVAIQPSWPFECAIDSIAEANDRDGTPVVYLGAGEQLDYLSGGAREELGWR